MNQQQEMKITLPPRWYHWTFMPAAAVAAGASVNVPGVMGDRDFEVIDIGFTSAPVGIPAAGPPFRIFIQDVGGNFLFGNMGFNVLALMGQNPFINDQRAYRLPETFTWGSKSQMLVTFTNIGTLASTPELIFSGRQL